MAIKLTSGYTLIPAGWHQFKITDVKWDEDFGKLEIALETSTGLKHTERFSLIGKDGEPNEGAMNAFSYLAKVALNDFERDEVEPHELIGGFLEGEITHDQAPSRKNPEKMLTFAHLGEKRPCPCFNLTSAPAGDTLSALLD